MHDKVRVTWEDLKFGEMLSWNIYDQQGKLLLSAGHVISSKETMEHLRRHILYRNIVDGEYGRRNRQKKLNAFNELDKYVRRLQQVFTDIVAADPGCKEKIHRLARDVIGLCRFEPEGALAVLRTPNDYPYAAYHALQCAIMCGLMVIDEDLYQDEQESMVAAALTANVAMRELQDKLHRQNHFLTDDELDIIDMHPEQGVALLQACGIKDETWLEIILQHHEHGDGSGYPRALYAKEISKGARMLAVADHYSENLLHPEFRQASSVDEAMMMYFGDNGEKFDSHYAQRLLEIMTVYPPGSFVKLTNGEIAIVIRRGRQDGMLPVLKSIAGANGKRYANPLLRDCSIHNYVIESSCYYPECERLNYVNLWGYGK